MTTYPFLTTPYTTKQALVYLFQCQTSQEADANVTVEDNGVGFNAVDAEILSSFAKQVLAGRGLSEKQLTVAQLRLPKYHGQLENGAWKTVSLPSIGQSSAARPEHSRIALDIESGGLLFYPNVFPSKQIKTIGFSYFKDGAWHQNTPRVHAEVLADLTKMFGDCDVAPEVTAALHPPVVQLPNNVLQDSVLKDYQKEAIQFQLTSKRALVAMAPRLGKTITTIKALQVAGCKRILVICPLSLLLDWKAKVAKWGDTTDIAVVYKKQLPVPATWTITNYDTLRLHYNTFKGEGWDAIVVDESLLIKNRKTVRTNVIRNLVKDTNPKFCWLLSGAPISKFYADLWAQFSVLYPKRFSSYWKFVERYCILQSNQWSKYNIVGNQPDAPERIKQDFQDIFFARTQEQVLDLPPWSIESISVPMSTYQDKMYSTMETDFLAQLEDGERLLAPIQLTQMLRLIQIASNPLLIGGKDDSPKWKAIEEMLEYSELPMIIWTAFVETANHLSAALMAKKYSVSLLTGATSNGERQAIVDAFQNGQLNILVAHPGVGKYGLDLYNAKTVVYLERTHDGDNYYQSLNRVRHIDAKISPRIVHLLSARAGTEGAETVDHVINKVLQTKRENVLKITTGNIINLFKGAS